MSTYPGLKAPSNYLIQSFLSNAQHLQYVIHNFHLNSDTQVLKISASLSSWNCNRHGLNKRV